MMLDNAVGAEFAGDVVDHHGYRELKEISVAIDDML